MSKLRNALIKLAYENPEIRSEILPILKESGEGTSYMAVSNLQKVADQAQQLLGMIDKYTMLDDWVESHITEAASKLDDVFDHLKYPNDGPGVKVAGKPRRGVLKGDEILITWGRNKRVLNGRDGQEVLVFTEFPDPIDGTHRIALKPGDQKVNVSKHHIEIL